MSQNIILKSAQVFETILKVHKNSHEISFSNSAEKSIYPESAQKTDSMSFSKVQKKS